MASNPADRAGNPQRRPDLDAAAQAKEDALRDIGQTGFGGRWHGGRDLKISYHDRHGNEQVSSDPMGSVPRHHTAEDIYDNCQECKADVRKGIHPMA